MPIYLVMQCNVTFSKHFMLASKTNIKIFHKQCEKPKDRPNLLLQKCEKQFCFNNIFSLFHY